MSDTTVFSSYASITESEISFGVSAVASSQGSQNAKETQSPVAAVVPENAAPEVSFIENDDVEKENPGQPPFETVQANQVKTNTESKEASMEEDDRVYIKVLADKETIYRFLIKSDVKLAKLMGAYSLEANLPIGNFRFYYQGKMVDKDDTVQSLALHRGSVIDALTDLEGWDHSFNQFMNSLSFHDI
ncbi:hypothetical protein KR026_002068 [Drosophila bipectinata]|nr:hypothetical protein KR026_002068 [Drosophila bipectinata]